VSVEVAQVESEPAVVLLEVSSTGVPVPLEPVEARLTAAGLVRAAAGVEVTRGGGSTRGSIRVRLALRIKQEKGLIS
jgi:hypothetical protein